MKTHLISTLAACVLVAATSAAQAECYADYKAKQNGPLRLHYGVLAVSDAACGDAASAGAEAAARLAQGGWTLLQILSTFGPEGLAERKDRAGEYFLRY